MNPATNANKHYGYTFIPLYFLYVLYWPFTLDTYKRANGHARTQAEVLLWCAMAYNYHYAHPYLGSRIANPGILRYIYKHFTTRLHANDSPDCSGCTDTFVTAIGVPHGSLSQMPISMPLAPRIARVGTLEILFG